MPGHHQLEYQVMPKGAAVIVSDRQRRAGSEWKPFEGPRVQYWGE